MKRIVFAVLLAAIPAIAIETLSRSALHRFEARDLTRFDVDGFVASRFDQADYEVFLEHAFHPELGWDNPASGRLKGRTCAGAPLVYHYAAEGERIGSSPDPRPVVVATYGDSFTHGDDVEAEETWQARLGARLGGRVLNFGTGGYGTDQAVKKFALHADLGRVAPATILGIYEENLLRIPGAYRPFHQIRSGSIYGFKPFVSVRAGRVAFEANPNAVPRRSIDELARLVRQVEREDYWTRDRNVRVRFPFTWSLLSLVFDQHRSFVEDGRSLLGLPATTGWADDELVARMDFVIGSFIERCALAGTRPIVLFVPKIAHGRPARPYHAFLAELRSRHPSTTFVDVGLASPRDWLEYNPRPGRCHPSPSGHQTIADHLLAEAFPG